VVTDDPDVNRLRSAVQNHLANVDKRLLTHDFRMVRGEGHTNLIFDVSLPVDLKGREKTIKTELESYLTEQEGQRIYTVITFDPEAFNQIAEH
jgi:hypothetical protein